MLVLLLLHQVVEPPILPSISLPSQILPEPLKLPRAVLEISRAEAPSYVPMLAFPSELRPPVGVAEEGEVKEEKEPPPPPEIQTITIPWIDHELPVPKEEIVVAAGTDGLGGGGGACGNGTPGGPGGDGVVIIRYVI